MKTKQLCRCCGEPVTNEEHDAKAGFLCASCEPLLEDDSPYQAAHDVSLLTGRRFEAPALELTLAHS